MPGTSRHPRLYPNRSSMSSRIPCHARVSDNSVRGSGGKGFGAAGAPERADDGRRTATKPGSRAADGRRSEPLTSAPATPNGADDGLRPGAAGPYLRIENTGRGESDEGMKEGGREGDGARGQRLRRGGGRCDEERPGRAQRQPKGEAQKRFNPCSSTARRRRTAPNPARAPPA